MTLANLTCIFAPLEDTVALHRYFARIISFSKGRIQPLFCFGGTRRVFEGVFFFAVVVAHLVCRPLSASVQDILCRNSQFSSGMHPRHRHTVYRSSRLLLVQDQCQNTEVARRNCRPKRRHSCRLSKIKSKNCA